MTQEVLQFPVILEPQVCVSCGVKFAFPSALTNQLRESHKEFYCPNGHGQHYVGTSNTDIIAGQKKTIDELRASLQRIADIEPGIFNKHSLELAIELANNALNNSK